MPIFQTKKYEIKKEGMTIAALTGDWEKDAVSIFADPEKLSFAVWVENAQHFVLVTDRRPTETPGKVEVHDLYAIAFNKKEYEVKNFDTNGWDKRQPTAIEQALLQHYEAEKSKEPTTICGQLLAVDISNTSIKKAKALKSFREVLAMEDLAASNNWMTAPDWVKNPSLINLSGGNNNQQGGRKGKSFTEVAEEKLQWISSVDMNLVARAAQNINQLISSEGDKFSLKEIVLEILRSH